MPLNVGTRLGSYEVTAKIGQGGAAGYAPGSDEPRQRIARP